MEEIMSPNGLLRAEEEKKFKKVVCEPDKMFPNGSKVESASILMNFSVGVDNAKRCIKIPQELFIHSNVSLDTTRNVSMEVANLAPTIGVLVAILVYAVINIEDLKVYTKLRKFAESKNLSRVIVSAILILSSPTIISLTLLALLYKVVCFWIIRDIDKNFASFLNGFDVFWSLEDEATKNVINVLGIIETISSETLVERIKQKLRAIVNNKCYGKMFYRRHEKFGWYYWRKYTDVNLDEYVKILNIENKNDELTNQDLEDVMSELSYHPLPFHDKGMFQILVTKQSIGKNETRRSDYGIIFRIDHALGDGVALIKFLCQSLSDQTENDPDNLLFMPSNYNATKEKPSTNLLNTLKQLCTMIICFVDGILRKPDFHSLHGPSLLGKKLFKWTDPQENLFQMIREIKQNEKDMTFSDILATSLSSGLRKYFAKTMDHIPEDVAVILPIRLPNLPKNAAKNELKLGNNFTVTILDLPTKEKRPIKEIRRRCNLVRKSVDPLVNHYFLKVCYLLPKQILRPLFKSSQATLIFSNMPGPNSVSICGGNLIKSLIFFIPNKGTTGLGVSALSYGGVLRFSAMADARLVPTSDHLSLILDAMVDEIRQMHAAYVN